METRDWFLSLILTVCLRWQEIGLRHCCTGSALLCRPFSAMASRACGAQAVGLLGSVVVPPRLHSCGAPAWALQGMCDLPEPGIELKSPPLAGGFFTTEPPGKLNGTLGFLLFISWGV